MKWVACLFPIKSKILTHSRIRTSSVFFIIEQHFDFIIVSIKNALCNSKVIPNGRSLLKVISEIIGNFGVILSPNLFNKCLNKTEVSNINAISPHQTSPSWQNATQFDTCMMRNDGRELLRFFTSIFKPLCFYESRKNFECTG